MCWVNRSSAIITNINHTGNNRDVNLYTAIGETLGAEAARLWQLLMLSQCWCENGCDLKWKWSLSPSGLLVNSPSVE